MEKVIGRLGGKLGIGVALLGFIAMFLGWNGAASFGDLRQQFPYLLSGGVVGLGLVVLGAALLITESLREQRAEMIAAIHQLRAAVERQAGPAPDATVLAGPGQVVAARSSFHRPSCRLIDGQLGLRVLDLGAAVVESLEPCRVCDPLALPVDETDHFADDTETEDAPRTARRARAAR